MIEGLNLSSELVTAIISYVVPAVLGVAITFAKPFAEFIWHEVISTWRGAIIGMVLIVTILIFPPISIWLTLVTFIGLVSLRLRDFKTGTHLRGEDLLLFAGFYRLSGESRKLQRSGICELLDAQFFRNLTELIAHHKIQDFLPLHVRMVKLPAVIYSRDTYETFDARMRKYAMTNLCVIWGIVDDTGRVSDFQITINEQNYWGRETATRLLRDIGRVFEIDGLSSSESIDFVAKLLAALWGQSFCGMLNTFGKWQASLQLASQSRLLIEQATNNLARRAGDKGKAIAEFERGRLEPMCLFEEAAALGRNNDERALDKLHEALMVDPLWPLDEHEFTEFYNNRYAWYLSNEEPLAERLTAEQPKYYTRGLVRLPPNLQVFADWIMVAATAEVKDLGTKVFNWFSALTKAHPNNVFLFLFWADAIRFVSRAKDEKKGRTGSFLDGYIPPLKTLNGMIDKLEKAFRLRPDLPIVSSRLAVLYFMSTVHFKTGSAEFQKRMKLMAQYGKTGGRFFDEYIPDDSVDDHKSETITGAVA